MGSSGRPEVRGQESGAAPHLVAQLRCATFPLAQRNYVARANAWSGMPSHSVGQRRPSAIRRMPRAVRSGRVTHRPTTPSLAQLRCASDDSRRGLDPVLTPVDVREVAADAASGRATQHNCVARWRSQLAGGKQSLCQMSRSFWLLGNPSARRGFNARGRDDSDTAHALRSPPPERPHPLCEFPAPRASGPCRSPIAGKPKRRRRFALPAHSIGRRSGVQTW